MSDSTARAEIAQLLRQFAGEIEEWMQRPQELRHEELTKESLLPSLDDEPAGLGDRFRVWCEPKLRVIRSHCLTTGLRDVVLEIESRLKEAVDYLDALWDFTGGAFRGVFGSWNIAPAAAALEYTLGRSTPVDEFVSLLQGVATELVGRDRIIDCEVLAYFRKCTSDQIRDALKDCQPVNRGKKGAPRAWWYSAIVNILRSSKVKAVRGHDQWPNDPSEVFRSEVSRPTKKSIAAR